MKALRVLLLALVVAELTACGLFSSSSARPKRSIASQKTVSLSQARKYIGKLLWPVPKSGMSSKFGQRWSSFHEGIDIRAPEGTPVYAAHAGQIVYSSRGMRGYGNLIVLRGDGLLTVYAHNRRNLVEQGDLVQPGDHIADLGQTGKATGPHLHFETRVRDASGHYAAVDPMVFFVYKR